MFWSKSSNWDSARDMPSLNGKIAIVTGGNIGLGREMVKQLAAHGAKVYMASRNEEKARRAIEEILKEISTSAKDSDKEGSGTNVAIEFLKLDLCDLKGCLSAAKEFISKEERLDILINNAGVLMLPHELTKDGVEIQLQSNYLGHFAFTLALLPQIVKTSRMLPDPSGKTVGARIVNLSSEAHSLVLSDPIPSSNGQRKGPSFKSREDINRTFGGGMLGSWKGYAHSKLCNMLFTRELAKRLNASSERIWVNSAHPGATNTGMGERLKQQYPVFRLISFLEFFLNSPHKGALSALYPATSNDIERQNISGEYFILYGKLSRAGDVVYDEALAKDLWDLSVKIVKDVTGEDIEYTIPSS